MHRGIKASKWCAPPLWQLRTEWALGALASTSCWGVGALFELLLGVFREGHCTNVSKLPETNNVPKVPN